jgi:hypothetical protein
LSRAPDTVRALQPHSVLTRQSTEPGKPALAGSSGGHRQFFDAGDVEQGDVFLVVH